MKLAVWKPNPEHEKFGWWVMTPFVAFGIFGLLRFVTGNVYWGIGGWLSIAVVFVMLFFLMSIPRDISVEEEFPDDAEVCMTILYMPKERRHIYLSKRMFVRLEDLKSDVPFQEV